jgi:PAS domain S-box-containing protein
MGETERLELENAQALGLIEAESLLKHLASSFPAADAQQFLSEYPSIERLDIVEARYQTLVEQIPAVIFMALLDEGVSRAYVSPQIEMLLGFTQEEWLNDPVRWYWQIHPEDRGRWSIEAAELFLTGQPLRSVYRVMARDGNAIWFHCHAKMVRREDGRPWFIHGVAFDITDLKRAEEGLRKAHDELEDRVEERTAELSKANAELAHRAEELARANADLEQFAYSASHDLQEPIRNVAVFAELLKDEYQDKLDARGAQFLGFITEGAQRMNRLVNDLLTYMWAGSAGEEASQSEDANAVLAVVLDSVQTLISENQATITHAPLPKLNMPKAHLQLVFQNLISNAIKYRSAEPPCVDIGAKALDGYWLVSVKDNGLGIAAEHHQKIFGLFKRLHSKAYPGTGLGLAICKRIVERYGGRIWVESEIAQGATFLFTVPIGR